MKQNFSELSIRQLYLFRGLYILFWLIVFFLMLFQTQEDAAQLKADIANDFSDKVKLVDTTILSAQAQVEEIANLYNSGVLDSDTSSFDRLLEKMNVSDNFYEKKSLSDGQLWNLFGFGDIRGFSDTEKKAANIMYQAGRFLPISVYSNEYPAAALFLESQKMVLMYPHYDVEKISENLLEFGHQDFWQNGAHFINNFRMAMQSPQLFWLVPHNSYLNNEAVVTVIAALTDFESGQQVGVAYLDVELSSLSKHLEGIQGLESNLILTVNDGVKHQVIGSTNEFTLKKVSEHSSILSSPLDQHIPKVVSQYFNLTEEWFVVDEDIFLISLPLSNSAFRLSYFTNNSNFYLANSASLLSRAAALLVIIFFGVLMDHVIRRRFLQPMTELHQELQLEQAKLKETLDDLKTAQKELVESEKMASLGQLVAGVAHEINTPVGIAVTAATHGHTHLEELSEGFTSGKLTKKQFEKAVAELEKSHEYVMRNLSRAADLIHNFKQISSDRSTDEVRVIMLGDYVQRTINSLQPQIKRTQIEVTVSCVQDVEIETIPGAVSQIVTNLVLNAVMHAFKESQQGSIEITIVTLANGGVQICVSDDGIGMSEEIREKVFQPFFTTRRGQGGTGLGLSICYNLIGRTLKGSVTVQSKVGEGSCFTVTLPAKLFES